MSDLISGVLKVECLECKASASKPCLAVTGDVDKEGINLMHEDWCGFYLAISVSRLTAIGWIQKHGYPIRTSFDGKPIVAIHPSENGWTKSKIHDSEER